MALIQVDDTNFQKISRFTNVPADQIKDTDLITGLHNGGNANFRIYDIVSKVMEGIDIDPGQDPGYDPGGDLGEQVTYSVIIDESKSDPFMMVEYADDAIGQNVGWNNWKTKPLFKNLKLCLMTSGKVNYYLNHDNLLKNVSGNNSDIGTTGRDVMLELPERLGYKFTRISEDKVKISLTNRPNAPGFDYSAFSYQSYNDCESIYICHYPPFISNGVAYGKYYITPGSSTFTNYKNACMAKTVDASVSGNYGMQTWYTRTLWDILYLIVHKNLNSQVAVGIGPNFELPRTETTVNYGFDNERSSPTGRTINCMGLQNPWGYAQWVDLVRLNENRELEVYDYHAGQWENMGTLAVSNGYIGRIKGTNKSAFAASQTGGSSTTRYCDTLTIDSNSFNVAVGSGSNTIDDHGIFSFRTHSDLTTASTRFVFFKRG